MRLYRFGSGWRGVVPLGAHRGLVNLPVLVNHNQAQAANGAAKHWRVPDPIFRLTVGGTEGSNVLCQVKITSPLSE